MIQRVTSIVLLAAACCHDAAAAPFTLVVDQLATPPSLVACGFDVIDPRLTRVALRINGVSSVNVKPADMMRVTSADAVLQRSADGSGQFFWRDSPQPIAIAAASLAGQVQQLSARLGLVGVVTGTEGSDVVACMATSGIERGRQVVFAKVLTAPANAKGKSDALGVVSQQDGAQLRLKVLAGDRRLITAGTLVLGVKEKK